jgi:sugar lactone lactonase YvrE
MPSINAFGGAALSFFFACSALAQPFTFTHLAGTAGGPGFDDGAGSSARFHAPQQVAVDGDGNVYVADALNHTIRKISPSGFAVTLAGLAGVSGSTDGTGGGARFNTPLGVAVAGDGTVYVADTQNQIIRKVTAAGTVTTIAGDAQWPGSSDGTGSAARFNSPERIAVAANGTLYVCDSGNHTIRKITTGGVVTTLAGSAGTFGSTDGVGSEARFRYPDGLGIDFQGTLYVTDGGAIRKVTAAGVVTTLAGSVYSAGSTDGTGADARFDGPVGAAVDAAGNVFVADTYNHTIRKVTAGGVVTTFAGLAGTPGTRNGDVDLARFAYPVGIAVDPFGSLFVSSSDAIRKIDDGIVATLAGRSAASGTTDGTGTVALFDTPWGMAVDGQANLFVTDVNVHIVRKVTSAGVVTTFAGLAGAAGSTEGFAATARFNAPNDAAVDANGNVLVADLLNQRIRRITPDQVVTTSDVLDFYPYDVATDSAGNRYVSDFGQTVRKIDPSGAITVLAGSPGQAGSADGTGSAARFSTPRGLAVDAAGNVYVADYQNHTIRKITSGGVVTTLAGLAEQQGSEDGTGSAARFRYPAGLCIGTDGNLYVTDTENNVIRKVTPAGQVTTVGGLARAPGSSDGTGSGARFNEPWDVQMDSAGNLYVTDAGNRSIRKGAPALAGNATIDAPAGAVGAMRQLGTTSAAATGWHWEVIRRPVHSTADLSSATVSNPVFTPDVAGLFVFRLNASNAGGSSITTVSLVGGSATTAALVVSAASSGCSQSRTLTATVASGVAGTIGGSVTFKKDGTLLGNVPLSGGQAALSLSLAPGTYSFTAEYSGNGSYLSSVSSPVAHQVTAQVPAVPGSLQATATSTSQIHLSWSGNTCASYYQILRSSFHVPFSFVVNTSETTFDDVGLTPGVTYLYVVRAINDAGTSADSAADGATTILFTDDSLLAGSTRVKATHLLQLRTSVNAFRTSAGLSSFSFTDPALGSGTPVRASHILELRSALAAARSALALSAIVYSDPTITAGSTRVKAAHLQEIRAAVQ